MSYTHTLSIQGVTATLQMSNENSFVSYALTLRATSGEEMVTHGKLPQESIDSFIVINQHFKNPAEVLASCNFLSNPSKELEASINESIDKAIDDCNLLIQQNQLHHSYTSIAEPNLQDETESLAESLAESLSPILPSSPRSFMETSFAKQCIVEMQQEQEPLAEKEPLAEQPPLAQEPVQESVKAPNHEEELMDKIEYVHNHHLSGFNQTEMLLSICEYITKYNLTMWDYPAVRTRLVDTCYWIITRNIDWPYAINCAEKVMNLVGEPKEKIAEHNEKRVNQWNLFFLVADKLKLEVDQHMIGKYYQLYQEWRQKGTHPNLNRWKAMEFWLRNINTMPSQ